MDMLRSRVSLNHWSNPASGSVPQRVNLLKILKIKLLYVRIPYKIRTIIFICVTSPQCNYVCCGIDQQLNTAIPLTHTAMVTVFPANNYKKYK